MKKQPWGIYAGAIAMLWSFITIGLIAIFVVSGIMFSEVGSDGGLRDSWWIALLWVGEAISALGFATCLFFYVKNKSRVNKVKE